VSHYSQAETLHRLVKEALDSGAASSIEEAESMFRGYRLAIEIDASVVSSKIHQIALLSLVALAKRVFLGGVNVTGAMGVSLRAPLPLGNTLQESIRSLGATSDRPTDRETPKVIVGGPTRQRTESFQVRLVFEGWRGGIVPAHVDLEFREADAMPLSAVFSAALAVNEAFLAVRNEGAMAGRRTSGMSLWRPGATDWISERSDGPSIELLPSRLWLLGLGHLGQAFLWALSVLPYPKEPGLHLVLQDADNVTPSTVSTSILSEPEVVGQKKTRTMAEWAERRGFTTCICERWFDETTVRQEGEPPVALCGLDNALGRRALDRAGFEFVVEAGLGHGHQDFRTLRLHTLPGSRSAAELFPGTSQKTSTADQPAYLRLKSNGLLDQCGVTLLAGKAVGAPFVGSVAASLAVAELLRLLHGGVVSQVIDLDLTSIEHCTVVDQKRDFRGFNPGFVRIPIEASLGEQIKNLGMAVRRVVNRQYRARRI
jgi:hypothetical protein